MEREYYKNLLLKVAHDLKSTNIINLENRCNDPITTTLYTQPTNPQSLLTPN